MIPSLASPYRFLGGTGRFLLVLHIQGELAGFLRTTLIFEIPFRQLDAVVAGKLPRHPHEILVIEGEIAGLARHRVNPRPDDMGVLAFVLDMEHDDGTLTLHPSVWRKKDCGPDSWFRKGRIIWCRSTVGKMATNDRFWFGETSGYR